MSAEVSEIHEFAERILLGTRLEDKLYQPDRVVAGSSNQPFDVPQKPGRPASLAFDRGKQRVLFPTRGKLEGERERGLVLHYFANHELLALELMALCLLRFPEAPLAFRRGLVATMREEQNHLLLYRKRMNELGVEFGDFPVNDFFWRAIAPTESPLTFVAAMSLTLEQANLDFSLAYLRMFEEIGDIESSAIMRQVYEEEIGHVKHGVAWFDRWRPHEKNDFEEYQDMLSHPLTPRRAKGSLFDREGRARAGLSSQFIEKMDLFSSSRGRPPVVYFFDPCVETNLSGQSPKPTQMLFRKDFTYVMLFLAQADDVLVVDEDHSDSYLGALKEAGFDLPERLTAKRGEALAHRSLGGVEPWGYCRETKQRMQRWGIESGPDLDVVRRCSDKGQARLWRESFLAQQADPFWNDEETWSIESVSPLKQAMASVGHKGYEVAVLKAPLGASGHHMKRVMCREPIAENVIGYVQKIIKRQGHILVEPWLERVMDFGVQIDSRLSQPFLGWTCYFTSPSGRIRGYYLGNKNSVLSADVRRYLNEGKEDGGFIGRCQTLARFVADELSSEGYQGPAGIDCFVYRQGEALRARPLVETNVRYTMGHVALKLEKKLAPGVLALWFWLAPKDVQALGYQGFVDFAAASRTKHLMQVSERGMESGVLFTNDPAFAKGTLGMMWVDPPQGMRPEKVLETLGV